MVARRKASVFLSGNLSGFCPEKRSNGTRSQLRQGAVLGDWGPPQQAILQSKMQSVYHSALLASFVPIPRNNVKYAMFITF